MERNGCWIRSEALVGKIIITFACLPIATMDVLTAIRAYVTKAVRLAQGMKVLLLDEETVWTKKKRATNPQHSAIRDLRALD